MDDRKRLSIFESLIKYYDTSALGSALKMPIVTTKRDAILSVAKRWQNQYANSYKEMPDKKETYEKLKALNLKSCSEKDVAEIIGNDSWCKLTCDQCKRCVESVVEVGAPREYESSTAELCIDCLDIAREKLKAATGGGFGL
jgi:hypothetical protein